MGIDLVLECVWPQTIPVSRGNGEDIVTPAADNVRFDRPLEEFNCRIGGIEATCLQEIRVASQRIEVIGMAAASPLGECADLSVRPDGDGAAVRGVEFPDFALPAGQAHGCCVENHMLEAKAPGRRGNQGQKHRASMGMGIG